MIRKTKYFLRRIAQKITGLDLDNSALHQMQFQIEKLQTDLEKLRNVALYDPSLVKDAVDEFIEPKDFFTEENIIKQNSFLANLQAEQNIFTKDKSVVQFMCGAGLAALFLEKLVGSFHGLDSSGSLLKFAKKNIKSQRIVFSNIAEQVLESEHYDVALISAKPGRWSRLSVVSFIETAEQILKPDGILILELPYVDHSILGMFNSSSFNISEMVSGKINYIIAKKDLCLKFQQQKQYITKINTGTTTV